MTGVIALDLDEMRPSEMKHPNYGAFHSHYLAVDDDDCHSCQGQVQLTVNVNQLC